MIIRLNLGLLVLALLLFVWVLCLRTRLVAANKNTKEYRELYRSTYRENTELKVNNGRLRKDLDVTERVLKYYETTLLDEEDVTQAYKEIATGSELSSFETSELAEELNKRKEVKHFSIDLQDDTNISGGNK